MGGGAPSPPPPPPPPPTEEDPEVKKAKMQAAKAARLRKGRGASLITGEAQFLQPTTDEGRATLG